MTTGPAAQVEVAHEFPALDTVRAIGAIAVLTTHAAFQTGSYLGSGAWGTFLARLDGSCETPIAGLCEIVGGRLRLRGEILRPDGSDAVDGARESGHGDAEAMGADLAEELLRRAPADFMEFRRA